MSTQEDFGSYIVTGNDKTDQRIYAMSAGMPEWAYDNMIAILDYLNGQGIEYTWEANGDEVRLNLNDAPMRNATRITLLPRGNEPARIGRTMSNGIGYYLMSEVPDPEVAHRTLPPAQPTPMQALNQVKAALGRPMSDEQGRDITVPMTYTNGGVNRRDWIGESAITNRNGEPYRIYVMESSSDYRRYQTDHEVGPEEAMNSLLAISQSALDNAVEDMGLDAIATRASRAIALGDGQEPGEDEAGLDARIQEALDGANAGEPGSAARHAFILNAIRQDELEPLGSSEPSVAVLEGRALDIMIEAMGRDENADAADPMEAETADGASGYAVAGDGLEAMMAIDQGHPIKPDLVAHYASSELFDRGAVSETVRSMNLIQRMTQAGITLDDLTQDETSRPLGKTILNSMIAFNPERPWAPRTLEDGSVDQVQEANQRRIMDRIRTDLAAGGVQVDDLSMDERGIVEYHGSRMIEYRGANERRELTGHIGQVFVPDSRGVITTAFGDGDDFMLAPGHRAVILPSDGEHNLLERTRLIGYTQQLDNAIDAVIAADLHTGIGTTGTATSLNYVTAHADGFRHDTDFVERYQGPRGVAEAILSTEAGRVHYPSRLANTSGLMAAVRGQWENEDDLPRQTIADRGLTGGVNMSVIDDPAPGYFDPVMTTNGDTQQGLVRYLSADARVAEDGSIIPATGDGRTRTQIYYQVPGLDYSDFDTFDRTVMADMNLIHSVGLSEPAGVEQATLGGWTMEDAIVVTGRFARANLVPDGQGGVRPLATGDKISDFHGNKGVISKVVDTEDAQERARAEREGWSDLYDHVAAAGDTDVFMAPFSAVSRFNGGSAREILDGDGKARFIISENTADHKTVTYGADGSASSNKVGRSASAQLGWALQAHGAQAVMDDLYGDNMEGLRQAREYLNVVGMDVDGAGRLSIGYKPPEGVEPVVPDTRHEWDGSTRPIKLPFPVDTPVVQGDGADPDAIGYRSMDILPVLGADLRDRTDLNDSKRVNYTFTANYRTIYENAARFSAIDEELKADEALKADPDNEENRFVPLRDDEREKLQAGYDNAVAKLKEDPNTKRATYYRNLIKRNGPLLEAGRREREPLSASKVEELNEQRLDCERRARDAYSQMANQVCTDKLTGKHNIFKEGILSHQVDRSATAIWTPDPTLDLDTAAMSPDLMRRLHLKDGDPFLAWRDPVLTTGGVHCFHVKADESLTGFAISPVMAEYFDGDFDGDTLAIVGLKSDAAKREAEEKLSLKANLTNPLKFDKESGLYDLAINTGLDMQVGHESGDGHLMTDYQRLREDANIVAIWRRALDHGLDVSDPDTFRQKLDARAQALVDRMSAHVKDTLDASFAKAVTNFDDLDHHLLSVADNCLLTGAKGSVGKLRNYAGYLDASIDEDLCQRIEAAGGHRLASPDLDADTMADLRTRALNPDATFVSDMNQAVRAMHDFDDRRSYTRTDQAARDAIETAVADGKPVPGITDTAAYEDGKAVRARNAQADRAVNFATSTKAFGTGVAGKVSQRAMILTRGSDIMGDTLNLSSRATQGTLQIKHDAAKAVKVINSLTTGSRNVWSGKLVELRDDDRTESNWAPVKSGRQVATQDWIDSTYNYYTSPEGVDVDIDRESLDRLGDFVSKPTRRGPVINRAIFSPLSHLKDTPVAPIDLLAYGPDAQTKMDAVVKLAEQGAGLYDRAGAAFAPRAIKPALGQGMEQTRPAVRNAAKTAATAARTRGRDPWAATEGTAPLPDDPWADAGDGGLDL